jgi:hypothetical protein
MFCPNHYQEIKLIYGEKVNQVKNLDQEDWIKICNKLGLYVSVSNGKGSHCAVYKSNVCPVSDSSCLILTIPRNIYPNFQRDLIKKIVFYGLQSGLYTEDDFWKVLKI